VAWVDVVGCCKKWAIGVCVGFGIGEREANKPANCVGCLSSGWQGVLQCCAPQRQSMQEILLGCIGVVGVLGAQACICSHLTHMSCFCSLPSQTKHVVCTTSVS
jgi:hypothetical protein